jgi:hypothetical protein
VNTGAILLTAVALLVFAAGLRRALPTGTGSTCGPRLMVRLPADEGQLRSMVAQGLLDEGHSLELKCELPRGKAANVELAKDSPSSR